MHPIRILYYIFFVTIELVAVVAAIFGVVFFFVPFVALKAVYVLVSSRSGRSKGPSTPPG